MYTTCTCWPRIVLLAVSASFVVDAQVCLLAQGFPTAGQRVHYPLTGDFLDASGSGFHATAINTDFTTDRRNATGSAALLNGVDSYLQLPAVNGVIGSPALTVMLWVKPVAVNRQQTLFSYTAVGELQPGISHGVRLYIDDQGRLTVRLSHDFDLTRTTNRLAVNHWQQVALVFDGTQPNPTNRVQLFINGEQQAVARTGYEAIPSIIGGDGASSSLGALRNPGSTETLEPFGGGLDEFRLFNVLWSADNLRAWFYTERGLHLATAPGILIPLDDIPPGSYQVQGSDDLVTWTNIGWPIDIFPGSSPGSTTSFQVPRWFKHYRYEGFGEFAPVGLSFLMTITDAPSVSGYRLLRTFDTEDFSAWHEDSVIPRSFLGTPRNTIQFWQQIHSNPAFYKLERVL